MVSIVESKICTKISLFFFFLFQMSHLLYALFPIGVSYWESPKDCFWLGPMVNCCPYCHWVWWVPGTSHLYSWRLLAIRSTLALSTSHLLQSSSLAACPMIFPLKILFLISSGFIQMFEIQCSSARFSSAYTKSGMIQRRLAWSLHEDDTQIHEALKYNVLNFLWLVRNMGEICSPHLGITPVKRRNFRE